MCGAPPARPPPPPPSPLLTTLPPPPPPRAPSSSSSSSSKPDRGFRAAAMAAVKAATKRSLQLGGISPEDIASKYNL